MKISIMDVPKKYLREERWDILSKALQILLRGKQVKDIPAGELVIEVSNYKVDRIQMVARTERSNVC